MYPSINQYLDAITVSFGLFRSLSEIEFVCNRDDEPLFCAGSEAVIFKIKHRGRLRAMKLYTALRKNRADYYRCAEYYFETHPTDMIPAFAYYDSEISVYIGDGVCDWFPVLLIDWVEGEPLSDVLQRVAHLGRKEELSVLTNRFIVFCSDLLDCDFAHIDLKPANIMVESNGRFRLIDVDALYLPGYDVDIPEEQGTFWFAHPCRKESDYGKFLEDYPIVVILSAMLLLEQEPHLFERAHNGENLLFHPEKVLAMGDEVYCYALERFKEEVWVNRLLKLLQSRSPRIPSLPKLIHALRIGRGLFLERGLLEEDLHDFDECTPFFEGVAAVRMMDKWAFVASTGIFLSDFVFDAVGRFSEGVVAARCGAHWHLYDKEMTVLADFVGSDGVGIMSCGLINVRKEGLWGYCSRNGELVIAHKYEFARPFKCDGTAIVWEKGEQCLIKRSI